MTKTIGQLTQKSTPVTTDLIELEDGATGVSYYAELGDLPGTGGGGGGGVPSLGTMRPLTDFTQIGISGAQSVSEVSGDAITVATNTLTTTVSLIGLRRAVPSTPYRVAVFVQPNFGLHDYEALQFGFSDGTKYSTISLYASGGEVNTWSTATSRASNTTVAGLRLLSGTGFWIGMGDDGTTATWGLSADGVNFGTVNRVTKSGGYLGSSGYTSLFVGYMPYLASGTNYNMSLTLREWDEAGLSRTLP